MKILSVILLLGTMFFSSFSDTFLEDYLENLLESKYSYISDGKNHLELDFEIHETRNTVSIFVEIDDDYYRQRNNFNKTTFNNYIKQIEKTAKSEANGKNVIVKSNF